MPNPVTSGDTHFLYSRKWRHRPVPLPQKRKWIRPSLWCSRRPLSLAALGPWPPTPTARAPAPAPALPRAPRCRTRASCGTSSNGEAGTARSPGSLPRALGLLLPSVPFLPTLSCLGPRGPLRLCLLLASLLPRPPRPLPGHLVPLLASCASTAASLPASAQALPSRHPSPSAAQRRGIDAPLGMLALGNQEHALLR